MFRRNLLITASVLCIAAPLVRPGLALLAQAPGSGQSAAATSQPAATPAKLPEWDVVSVKPVGPQDKCTQGSGWRSTADGVNVFCVPLLVVIEAGYGIMEPSRIIGAPEWAKSGTQWNIDAKVSGEDVAAYGKLSPKDKDRMLRTILEDRFHMKAHIEQREMPVYELVVAKGGSKLKEATADETGKAAMISRGRGKVECVAMPLTSLPWILTSEVGRPVVDKTGLTGKYDFTLEYVPAAKAATDDTGGPSVFTAVEEQLGLKLEPAKAPMDVVVIDSIGQPAAN